MCPARDLLTQRLGALVRHPHRRQIIGRQELRQDLGIDLGSVLTFASAIARVFIGLEITTRIATIARSKAIMSADGAVYVGGPISSTAAATSSALFAAT